MKYADPAYLLLMGTILNFCAISIKEKNFKNQDPERKKKKKKEVNKKNTNTARMSLPNLEIQPDTQNMIY